MSDFTVVVPFGAGDTHRLRNLDVVRDWLDHHHPEWPLIVSSWDGSFAWSKGRVVELGVQNVTTEGLIVHDADVLVAPSALRAAALSVVSGCAWAMPHAWVYRLSRRGMMRRMTCRDVTIEPVGSIDLDRPAHHAPHGGGITVLTRAAWDVAPMDPRFVGWGGEDISWARALDTLVGEGCRGDAPMWHLWHPPDPTRGRGGRASRPNEVLASAYLDAYGDAELMRQVVHR